MAIKHEPHVSTYTKEQEDFWGDPEYVEVVAWILTFMFICFLSGFL